MTRISKICECGVKRYGYTDGQHDVYICYKCGRFEGTSGGDSEFTALITSEPNILLGMIDEKYLTPIE